MSAITQLLADAVTSPRLLVGVSYGFRLLALAYFGGLSLFGLILIYFNAMGWEVLLLTGYASLALIPHRWLRPSRILFWTFFCVSSYPFVRMIWMMLWMGSVSGENLDWLLFGLALILIGNLLIPLSLGASWLAWRYEREACVE